MGWKSLISDKSSEYNVTIRADLPKSPKKEDV